MIHPDIINMYINPDDVVVLLVKDVPSNFIQKKSLSTPSLNYNKLANIEGILDTTYRHNSIYRVHKGR